MASGPKLEFIGASEVSGTVGHAVCVAISNEDDEGIASATVVRNDFVEDTPFR